MRNVKFSYLFLWKNIQKVKPEPKDDEPVEAIEELKIAYLEDNDPDRTLVCKEHL
ncbi:hypothetical protein [Bacillus sp. FJAT-45037]|uniref:hypothetical protein n=1 Tax=Bacillus sp. FJAT-45037 TaxID=2011007 RepID=UPI0012FDC56D|nr:hypothetical protein [Bacillus sp. FJAT-45037]